ncbi:hypothetical protein FKM82_011450 [Ascaphus truei]
MHSELPSLSIFAHLQDSLCDSLLPFWAGFRKAWLDRSPASAQRVPVLRVQQMLRKRLALFEVVQTPLKTFHLPLVQLSPGRRLQPMITFSFSMSRGVTLKVKPLQLAAIMYCNIVQNSRLPTGCNDIPATITLVHPLHRKPVLRTEGHKCPPHREVGECLRLVSCPPFLDCAPKKCSLLPP